jgi:sugar phosphate isomerase/epimerase
MDVFWDVLQYRDHVMTLDEGAERLRHDLRLAQRLGFRNVRVLSTHPVEVLIKALPLAEELDIRLGKEIHQPMQLSSTAVREIVEHVERSGTRHLGIVPDFGIFQFRPSEALLGWFMRRGAQPATCDLVVQLCEQTRAGADTALQGFDVSRHTAGNVRSSFTRFVQGAVAEPDLLPAFEAIKRLVDDAVDAPTDVDYTVMAEALAMSSPATAAELSELAPLVISVHAKFYNMTERPGHPGTYHDAAIDYETPIAALKQAGYAGYVNSEYEGQRFWQDLPASEWMSEVEQVRRHQEMLRRLIEDGS